MAGADAPRKKKSAKAGASPAMPGKRKLKKKKSNKGILVLMMVGALVLLTCVGFMGYFLFSSSGKVPEMAWNIPSDCNLVRGLNTSQMARYLAFKRQLDLQTQGPIADMAAQMGAASGLDADAFLDYVMVAKRRTGGPAASDGIMYIYRTTKPVNVATLGGSLQGAAQPVGGVTTYKVPAGAGALANAVLYMPSDRIVVVVPPGPAQSQMVQNSVTARQSPTNAFYIKMGDTGKKASRNQIWTLVFLEGPLGNYGRDLTSKIKTDFAPIVQKIEVTKAIGYWSSYGARGIRFGCGFECESKEKAREAVNYIWTTEMGKGEDASIPNTLVESYRSIKGKDFREFLSNMKFSNQGQCAYLESSMNKDKAIQTLGTFASTNLGDPAAAASGAAGATPRLPNAGAVGGP
ncbi:MAG: hypothetical protein ACRCZF_10200 [Gemmataceae bacterium]